MVNPHDLQNGAVFPDDLTDRQPEPPPPACVKCGVTLKADRVGDTRRDDRSFDVNHGLCDGCRGDDRPGGGS